jgi:hypothetical protein
VADQKISELTALTGALNNADALAIADDSASQTKKISPKDLIEQGVLLIADGTIPIEKIDNTGGIPPGSVGTAELADGSVTAIKLADNSSGVVDTALPAAGVRVGQVALETTTDKFYVWNGSAWVPVKAAGSVNEITTTGGGLLSVVITETDDTVNIDVVFNPTTGPAEFIAGPTASGGAVSARVIVGDDLPTASDTEKGAIKVSGDGLRMDGEKIEIDNDIAANNAMHLCQYNGKGLVINSRAIEPSDLPIATDSTVGVVMPGTDLVVTTAGVLNHESKGTTGTYTKVTVNDTGHVTAGGLLESTDLPDVPAGNITGEIGEDQLAECSVTAPKICDYATCLMQEDNPGNGDFLGQFWFTPSTAQLRVYARGSGPENIWLPVGFGALQANNLRWLGTYDASNDTVVSLTAVGVSEGLTAGGPFPAPSDALSGGYFLCQTAGNSMSQPNLSGISHDAGDWSLCLDSAQGWIHIDAAAPGGGGGGSAQYLNDLLDVNIGGTGGPFSTAPALTLADRQILKYDGGAGMWRNTDMVDGGSY